MKLKKLFVLFSSAALLAACSQGEATSSSSSAVADSSSSQSSSASSSSSIAYGTLKEITIDAIPELGVKEELDLTPYVHFFDDKKQEMPLSALNASQLALNAGHVYGSPNTGSFAQKDAAANPLLIVGTQVGTADIRITYSLSDTDYVWKDATFSVKGNAETAALASKWAGLGKNWTAKMGESKGYRTASYVQDAAGAGLLGLKDGKAYSFDHAENKLNVYPGAKEGTIEEVLDGNYGAISFAESSFAYNPLTIGNDHFDYAIRQSASYKAFASLFGLTGSLTIDGGTYYLYQMSLQSTAEGFALRPIIFNMAMQLAALPAITFEAIGTTALSDLDAYIASGTIPTSNVAPIVTFVNAARDGHNYTIEATGEFYTKGEDGSLTVADKSLFTGENMPSFYEYSRKERQLLATQDGIYMHYYTTDDYTGEYSEVSLGYFNHTDGTICTFTMPDGKAKIGAKDTDWSGQATSAPYWNEYKNNLANLTEEKLNQANFVQEGDAFTYSYAHDGNGTYSKVGGLLLDYTHYDIGSLVTDTTYGTPIINSLTMSVTVSESALHYEIDIPMTIDEKGTNVLYRIKGDVKNVGSTVINGLSDILSGTPEEGDSGWGY